MPPHLACHASVPVQDPTLEAVNQQATLVSELVTGGHALTEDAAASASEMVFDMASTSSEMGQSGSQAVSQ
jgi:hypothetical protein